MLRFRLRPRGFAVYSSHDSFVDGPAAAGGDPRFRRSEAGPGGGRRQVRPAGHRRRRHRRGASRGGEQLRLRHRRNACRLHSLFEGRSPRPGRERRAQPALPAQRATLRAAFDLRPTGRGDLLRHHRIGQVEVPHPLRRQPLQGTGERRGMCRQLPELLRRLRRRRRLRTPADADGDAEPDADQLQRPVPARRDRLPHRDGEPQLVEHQGQRQRALHQRHAAADGARTPSSTTTRPASTRASRTTSGSRPATNFGIPNDADPSLEPPEHRPAT